MDASDFEGLWSVVKEVKNGMGPDAQFMGRATFTEGEEGVAYHETGTLVIGDKAAEVERRQIWVFEEERVFINTAEGKPFLFFDWKNPKGSHLFEKDSYDIAYDFSAFPVWTQRWRILGPSKGHVIEATYRRPA